MDTMNAQRMMSFIGQRLCPCRCRIRAFARRTTGQSPVQTACPERPSPWVALGLAGDRLAGQAASPGHRLPGPMGPGAMQGKIKGRGTKVREKAVCTWGGRGTCQGQVPCREIRQGRVSVDAATCHLRPKSSGFAGAAP